MNIISKEQSDMIDMILEGHTMTDIAKSLKLHRSTLYNWINRDIIKAELDERRRQLRKSAKDRITGNVGKLVENMLDLANNSTDNRVKLQANKYLLDQCIGAPTVAKDDKNVIESNDNHKDENTLKKEIDDIKKIRAVK